MTFKWATCLRVLVFIGVFLSVQVFQARAQCSGQEMTAVIVVSGVFPGTDMQVETLSVFPTGDVSNPTHEEILDSIDAIQPCDVLGYSQVELVGQMFQYHCWPLDFGGGAVVDSRSGDILFAGTVHWLGMGSVTRPIESSHTWGQLPSPELFAGAPSELGVMDNLEWNGDPSSGPEVEAADRAMEFLQQFDVVKSFSDCGQYSAVAYLYTPAVGSVDLSVASSVLVLNGSCGPPWSGGVVETVGMAWGQLKSIYR